MYLEESVERARSCADQRQQAWSLSLLARAHLLRGERSQSVATLARSLELVHEQRWMAFLPWPQTLRAELDLIAGDADGAADRLAQAWSLACQLEDRAGRAWPHAVSACSTPTVASTAPPESGSGEAASHCNRVPDRYQCRYQWVHAYVLDAMITNAVDGTIRIARVLSSRR